MASPPVPFLNRLVDQMLEHADPKADQNIWNLARAAEEVMYQDRIEQATPAEVFQLRSNELQEAHDILAKLREILDPDDRLEHELLTAVASMRMNELAEWRQGRRTTLRASQPGRYSIRIWDNNDRSNIRYGLIDRETNDWVTGDVGNEEVAAQLARAWNQGER